MKHAAIYVNSNDTKIVVIGNVSSCSLADSNFQEEPAASLIRVERPSTRAY